MVRGSTVLANALKFVNASSIELAFLTIPSGSTGIVLEHFLQEKRYLNFVGKQIGMATRVNSKRHRRALRLAERFCFRLALCLRVVATIP